MIRVRRALLSVSDKEGLVDFARGLAGLSVELLSTGGTARALREAGLPVTDVAQVTGFPEMLDGRVKTLHPRIHGALLALRGNPAHQEQLATHAIAPIDLVAVNLYPFEATLARPDATVADAIEQIDIGGPAMLRSAGKNFDGVAVVCDPGDYVPVLRELQQHAGTISATTRLNLARKAFTHTARYDALVSGFFERLGVGKSETDRTARLSTTYHGRVPGSQRSALSAQLPFPPLLHLRLEKIQDLRYGENPHQRAAFYRDLDQPGGLAAARQLHGKELSYNNLLDLQAAWETASDFAEPVVVIVKHGNPCGVAIAEGLLDAYTQANAADPVSAFGGIIATNRPLDVETARAIAGTFVEAVVAPGYAEDALTVLRERKNLRLLLVPTLDRGRGTGDREAFDLRRVGGGLLVQERDTATLDEAAVRTVTRRAPSATETRALRFAWRVVKHVKSNAIALATEHATVGIGAGQMSRVDAVKLAVMKAASPTAGTVLASDAFFPFRDGVDLAAAAGVTAVIQPGGSLRDADVIAAADEHGLAMVFTGMRHFRH
jgi:phosphoribosylaminoimidazolecarboxamide formyltransferase/IMP cyclohydrolase